MWTTEGEPAALDVEDAEVVRVGTGADHAELDGVIGPDLPDEDST